MKALVTGGTGFLGSHIADQLIARGDSVRALVRATSDTAHLRDLGAELVVGDITEPESLPPALEGIDVVYHAAAHVSDWDPWEDFALTTIDGTRNVLRAAAAAGVPRFLHVSTDGVYALSCLGKGVTEESPLEKTFGPLDYYRRSKLAAEKIVRRRMRKGDIGITIVRPALLLGERDAAMLPATMVFMKSGSAMYLGSGHNQLPYVYAGDVAGACILAVDSEKAIGETYNVVSDEFVTQRDLFAAAAEATGLQPPGRSVPVRAAYALAMAMEAWCLVRGRRSRPDLTRFGVTLLGLEYKEDASKIERELGWRPTVPLQEAVRRSIEWSRARRAQLVSS